MGTSKFMYKKYGKETNFNEDNFAAKANVSEMENCRHAQEVVQTSPTRHLSLFWCPVQVPISYLLIP